MTLKGKLKLGFAAILILLGLWFYLPRAYRGTVEVEVLDKERITYQRDGVQKSKYLIYCDGETFQNTDDGFYFKYNSSDLYGQIRRGERYRFTIVGWRISLFSKYRNIIAVDRIVEKQPEQKSTVEPEKTEAIEEPKEEMPEPEKVNPVDTIKHEQDLHDDDSLPYLDI